MVILPILILNGYYFYKDFIMVFEDYFSELQADMVSICLE